MATAEIKAKTPRSFKAQTLRRATHQHDLLLRGRDLFQDLLTSQIETYSIRENVAYRLSMANQRGL